MRVDPRFHVSRAAFVALLERSERLWEAPLGRDVLRYEPGGRVQVSLIYDGHTTAYLARAQARKTVDEKDAAIVDARADLDRLDSELVRRAAELATRKAALRERIDYWNARGGAPAKLFAELTAETSAVRRLIGSYNRDVARARHVETSLNALVRGRNALVLRMGDADMELGAAQVGGIEMKILALTGDADKDVTVAAHEFGHILGLEHVPGAANVMNPYLVRALATASSADLAALSHACVSER
jgi:hypothetical protein